MALQKFISIGDKLIQFEVDTQVTSLSEVSVFTLQIRRDRVRPLWERVEQEYEKFWTEGVGFILVADSARLVDDSLRQVNTSADFAEVAVNELTVLVGAIGDPVIDSTLLSPRAEVTGINGKVNRTLKVFHISIRSSHGPHVQIEIEAFVLSQVADDLPSCTIAQATLEGMPNIPLADPSFRLKAKIDLLLGIDVIPAVTLSGIQTEVCGSLMAQETRIGWKTTRRDVSGRYTVSLPFRDPTNINLGHSRPGALAQFLKNEGRLLKNIPAKTEYDAVIQEYLDLGHMRQVPFDGSNDNFYLPHHAVFKPDSTTTKVRVVFNASSKSTNGVSLNDILYPGPVLQSDLTTQILKWRFFRVVFNADITKMYRQIMVDPIHTPFQRILFRNKEGRLGDYELNTVTDIIKSYMYVDDVLARAHNEATAIAMVNELQDALGFPLRKWTSNVKSVLSCIRKCHLLNADFLAIKEASTAKTLGIRWKATTDEFYFVISPQDIKSAYTKRKVLGQIANLFDPAGWLAPLVIQAKVFMWQDFTKIYSFLDQIRIPRWVLHDPNSDIQFHCFCDASQRAYGAAIYVRVSNDQGISWCLLAAKSRVNLVKTVSLPRLELCGATLLAEVNNAEAFYWSDSTAVLSWLNKPPCTWTTFVANRVAKIVTATKSAPQRDYFPTEHRCLQQKKSLPTSSTILNLNPFIDASGVI
ncbi:uncharacterized protein [Drosophila tropicalis]|uniref:uncharacterized protein n=1 Tax=Drosophila tropicalis TaxID=46794 RepID=UPI0035ABC3DC